MFRPELHPPSGRTGALFVALSPFASVYDVISLIRRAPTASLQKMKSENAKVPLVVGIGNFAGAKRGNAFAGTRISRTCGAQRASPPTVVQVNLQNERTSAIGIRGLAGCRIKRNHNGPA
jgi:hypothetical protein